MPDISRTQRILAFLTVCIALTMAVLDSSIVNVALPTMARELSLDAPEAIWIVNGYQLAITISLLAFSSLGDSWSYKRVYCWGLAVFTLASLLCALSTSLPTLLASRILQGFGAAGVMSVNLALVRFIFAGGRIGRASGITAMVAAISSATGPSIAAGILSVAHWQWLFLVNVPLGLLALIVGTRTLPRTEPSGAKFDIPSGILSAATFGLLISGLDSVGRSPWPITAATLAGAIIFGTILTRRQLSLPAPLLPIDLLARPVFALSVATSICAFGSQMLVYISLPFYFQNVLGRSSVETGLLMTPWPLAIACAAPIAGRLADRMSPARLGAIGLGVMAGGLLLLIFLPADATTIDIGWRLAICGLGFGAFQSPNNKALITSAPPNRSGGASGLQSTARLLGQSSGAAIAAIAFALAGTTHQLGLALTIGCIATATGAVTSALRRFEKPATG